MSQAIIDIAKNFISSAIDGKAFTEAFFTAWRAERDAGLLAQDDKNLGRCLSIMFGLADSFTEGPKDRPSELNEAELKQELTKILKEYGYL